MRGSAVLTIMLSSMARTIASIRPGSTTMTSRRRAGAAAVSFTSQPPV